MGFVCILWLWLNVEYWDHPVFKKHLNSASQARESRCFSDLCASLYHPIYHVVTRNLAITKISQCLEIGEMEIDPLTHGRNHLCMKCLFQTPHSSWRVQELGSHCAKPGRRSVTMAPLLFILHIFLFILSAKGQRNILSFCFQRQASCWDMLIHLWGHSAEGAVGKAHAAVQVPRGL